MAHIISKIMMKEFPKKYILEKVEKIDSKMTDNRKTQVNYPFLFSPNILLLLLKAIAAKIRWKGKMIPILDRYNAAVNGLQRLS